MKLIPSNSRLLTLFVSTFLFFTNEAFFLPTLPLHLSASGYTNFRIGTVLGAFAVGVLLARPLTGLVTDRLGRKVSLVIGVFIFFAFPACYLLTLNFAWLLVIRFFHGLGIAFYTTAFPAYVTDTADPESRGEVMGHMATSITLAFVLGPLMGASVYKTFGFTYLVWLCTLTGLLNLMVILMIPESRSRRSAQTGPGFTAAVLKRGILVPSGMQLVYGTIFGGTMTFLPLLLDTVEGLSIGVYFMVESVVVIGFRLVAARLPDRYGRAPVFFYSFLTILGAVLLISKITTLALLVLAAVVYGLGISLCAPSLTALVADESDPDARGIVFSFVSSAFDTGVIGAGMLLGIVADLAGIRTMFQWTAGAGFLALALFAVLIRKGVLNSLSRTLVPRRKSPSTGP